MRITARASHESPQAIREQAACIPTCGAVSAGWRSGGCSRRGRRGASSAPRGDGGFYVLLSITGPLPNRWTRSDQCADRWRCGFSPMKGSSGGLEALPLQSLQLSGRSPKAAFLRPRPCRLPLQSCNAMILSDVLIGAHAVIERCEAADAGMPRLSAVFPCCCSSSKSVFIPARHRANHEVRHTCLSGLPIRRHDRHLLHRPGRLLDYP